MLFIMFCEVFYLLTWATVGFIVSRDSLPPVFGLMPFISVGAAVVLALWILYFRGAILPANRLRDKRIFHAFRMATFKHYVLFFLLRSPALLSAVLVYTIALNLFGVQASLLPLLGYLPIIFFAATVPTPMRAAAITLWVVLFPDNEGQMAAFGFVQHNFFILFNALIGVVFWRRAQRELLGRVIRMAMPSPPSGWRWSCPWPRPSPGPSCSRRASSPSCSAWPSSPTYLDGRVARMKGTASAWGRLFDHGTDCLFVTGGLAGAAMTGAVTPLLPVLVPIAFGQYVVDSYVWHRQRQLRASALGRWNGVLYFVALVLIAASRLHLPGGAFLLCGRRRVLGYVLVASTVVSVIDRARLGSDP